MNRRGFLQSCIALGAAPAIVQATSIMPCIGVIIEPKKLILPSQEIYVQEQSLEVDRVWTVRKDSMAFMEAQAEGLVELRRAGDVVQFALPTPPLRPRQRGDYLNPSERLHRLSGRG